MPLSVTVQVVPPKAFGDAAVSTMLCAPAHENVTGPAAGCVNVKTYGPAPLPVTAAAATPFTSKSAASTPFTTSLKFTSACVSVATVEFGAGVTATPRTPAPAVAPVPTPPVSATAGAEM